MSVPFTPRLIPGLLLAAALAGTAAAGVPVKLEDVPKSAVQAVRERFARAAIRSVDREANGDYEFALKDGERLFDVGVKADGRLLNIKEDVPEDRVPKAVKDGLLKQHPGAKIVETEKVVLIDGAKERVTYELKIKVEKMTLEVVLDATGKPVGQ